MEQMKSQLNLDAILNVGKVISVKGRTVEVLVSKTKNSSVLLYNGEIIKNVSVGSYIKICKGFKELVGKIEGEYITEDKNYSQKPYKHERERIKRILSISLLGYFEGNNFKQGIKELPLLDNECFLLTQSEVDKVHNFIMKIKGVPDLKMKIGNLASEKGRSVEVGINSLLASHIGIFGNTGSGKSYTLASIYNKLFKKFQENDGFKENSKFLIIDFNGEFSSAKCITENKTVYNLSTRKQIDEISDEEKLPLNESTLIDVELLSILANATEKTQKPFITRTIKLYKKVTSTDYPIDYFRGILRNKLEDILSITHKDRAHSLLDYLGLILLDEESYESRTNQLYEEIEWHNTLNYFFRKNALDRHQITEMEIQQLNLHGRVNQYEFPDNAIQKIIHFLYLQLINDLYNHKSLQEHIGPAINKLKSKTNELDKVFNFQADSPDYFQGKNILVINLNETNIDIRKLIPLVVSKHIYDNHKIRNREDGSKYLNIIIDEAHNILSYNSERESATWKDYRLETFEEIIKEGRKFGVFLTVASQRPSDISDTIISQLHNYFLHRLINNFDIQKVERTISYLDRVSSEALSILPTGTCILAGLSAHIPVIVEIDKIPDENEPENKTIKPTDFWD